MYIFIQALELLSNKVIIARQVEFQDDICNSHESQVKTVAHLLLRKVFSCKLCISVILSLLLPLFSLGHKIVSTEIIGETILKFLIKLCQQQVFKFPDI